MPEPDAPTLKVELREYFERILDERESLHRERFEASQRALEHARGALDVRLESMNEFRAQILLERVTYVRKDHIEPIFQRMEERIRKLEDGSNNRDGRFWALGVALVILTTVMNAALRFLGR